MSHIAGITWHFEHFNRVKKFTKPTNQSIRCALYIVNYRITIDDVGRYPSGDAVLVVIVDQLGSATDHDAVVTIVGQLNNAASHDTVPVTIVDNLTVLQTMVIFLLPL